MRINFDCVTFYLKCTHTVRPNNIKNQNQNSDNVQLKTYKHNNIKVQR